MRIHVDAIVEVSRTFAEGFVLAWCVFAVADLFALTLTAMLP